MPTVCIQVSNVTEEGAGSLLNQSTRTCAAALCDVHDSSRVPFVIGKLPP